MARAKLREISAALNPKSGILESIGDAIDYIHPTRYEVIVAIYIRSEKTIGGVYLPDTALSEDRFQGKVGLIVKHGPLAFTDPDHWGDVVPKLHDWVCFNPNDGSEFFILDKKGDGTPAKAMDDIAIRRVVDDPTLIW